MPDDQSERDAFDLLSENGFFVPDYATDRRNMADYFHRIKHSTDELHITVLTTLQCNFACGYCYQGDREDFNQFADKMTLETSGPDQIAAVKARLAASGYRVEDAQPRGRPT